MEQDDEVMCNVISIYSEKVGQYIVNRVMIGEPNDVNRYLMQMRNVLGQDTRFSVKFHRLHKADSKAGKVSLYMKGETL